MDEMRNARRVMVDNQIRTFDVTDQVVLAAFEQVAREAFVDSSERAIAYSDRPMVTGSATGRRHMLPPLILARMLQALEARDGEIALEVLGGTGYGAALMAAMGLKASLLEADQANTDLARKALASAGQTVSVLPADAGLTATSRPALAPASFDCILVSGAVEVEPAGLLALLRDGGRLVVILKQNGASRAVLYVKAGETVGRRRIFDVQAPLLPGFAKEPAFEF